MGSATVNLNHPTSPKEWKPTQRQEDFVSLPDSIFEALYGGAAGGAKTESLMMLPLVRGFHNHPRFKMLLLRRTFPELDSEVIPRSQERGFYKGTGGDYNSQHKRWKWPSGAMVQFGHCEYEKDVKKYDTSEYNIIAFDEATSFTEYQYMYLTMSRCRSSAPDLPAIVRAGTNPGGVSHGFFRDRFVAPAREGYTVLREKRLFHGIVTELKRIFIPSKVEDNTYLMAADPGYVGRLNMLPEAERAAKLLGDWWTFSGQVFDEWRVDPFPDEPHWARHVVAPFKIPEFWPRVLSIDWGYAANTVAGWYAINPYPDSKLRAKVYKYRELVRRKTKINDWATEIKDLSANETISLCVLDPSAWGSRGDEFTIAQQFVQASGFSPMKADNDRVGGKTLLQEYLRWKPQAVQSPLSGAPDAELELKILRTQGEAARAKYLNLFKEQPIEILPKFQVFENCAETIKVIPLCVYDKTNVEDVAEFDGDDAYDETRYGIKACQLFLEGGQDKFKEAKELSKILAPVQENLTAEKLTNFYIKMANHEARTASRNFVVRRRRRFN